MRPENFRIFSVGSDALTVEFGQIISENLNQLVTAFSEKLLNKPFDGFIECVPAYASVTVFYDLDTVRKSFPQFPTAFSTIKHIIENLLNEDFELTTRNSRIIEVPFLCNSNTALDLSFVADHTKMSEEKVLETFLAKTYRVFMLGFLPGFAYMGKLDMGLAVPRKLTPRLKVPAGSVGLAGLQTGIYPFESPGGWQIIGHTDVMLFDRQKAFPTLFRVGDTVKFVRV